MKPFGSSPVYATLFFVTLGAGSAVSAGPLFSIQNLGPLGSGAAMATALNSSGNAVGFVTNAQGQQVPVSFSHGSVTSLGAYGEATGINSSGTIVGTTASGVTEWSGGQAASLHIAGYGNAINDSGQVAGAYQASATQTHAFEYTNNILKDFGTLGGSWSSANAISSNGQIAGASLLRNGAAHAFISNGFGLTDIGTLGGVNSYANGISSQGKVVGTAQTSAGSLNAFSWTAGGMVDLGTLGGSVSGAYGVNDSGEIVGYSLTTGNTSTHGFLDQNGVMLDLNSLLPAGSQWTVTGAYAVDNAGDILGTGSYLGHSYAVELRSPASDTSILLAGAPLATPEPAAFLLVGIGLIAVARFRLPRRSKSAPPSMA